MDNTFCFRLDHSLQSFVNDVFDTIKDIYILMEQSYSNQQLYVTRVGNVLTSNFITTDSHIKNTRNINNQNVFVFFEKRNKYNIGFIWPF